MGGDTSITAYTINYYDEFTQQNNITGNIIGNASLFTGLLTVDKSTGVVRITNPKPAGD